MYILLIKLNQDLHSSKNIINILKINIYTISNTNLNHFNRFQICLS